MASRGALFELFAIFIPTVGPIKTIQQKTMCFFWYPARMGPRESLGRLPGSKLYQAVYFLLVEEKTSGQGRLAGQNVFRVTGLAVGPTTRRLVVKGGWLATIPVGWMERWQR